MTALVTTAASGLRSRLPASPGVAAPVLGTLTAVVVWWLLTDVVFASRAMVSDFSPVRAVAGLGELVGTGTLLEASATSVYRLLVGLGIAALIGLAGGLLVGSVGWIDHASRPSTLFLRMVSPLSWAPVAVVAFGIGNAPVIALVAAAAVWPILTSTADGVRRVQAGHREVARGLGATRAEVLRHVVVPSVQPAALAGLRLAIGLGWVVLVPAEMLGVTSGLGYQILNAKDQFAYHHITALILVIGTIGYALDVVARWLLATRRDRRQERRPDST